MLLEQGHGFGEALFHFVFGEIHADGLAHQVVGTLADKADRGFEVQGCEAQAFTHAIDRNMQVLRGMQHGAVEIDNDAAYAEKHQGFSDSVQDQTRASSLSIASISAL
ncbi:hypothetical protein D3C81_2035960 [compost metagenome]